MKKMLFVGTVVKHHIMSFHIPYLEWFKQHGYETHVCARNDYENKEDCIIPYCDKYYDLPFERLPFDLNNIVAYKELKKIIEFNEYDIIHCHTPIGGVLTRLAAKRARKNGTKVIYTAHGFHFYKGAHLRNWVLFYSVERWLARYTDVLITINEEDYARAKKTFKAGRVEYIPGVGIDTKKISEVVVDKLVKFRELGVPKCAFVILSVGEINKNKNHEIVIKAVAKLNNPNIYYIICGEGPLENYLKDLIKKLGLEKQVKLLGYREDITEISKVSEVFAFPSFREGLAVALMEAMASGLPVVCSKIRGNVDLVDDDQGGYLIEPDNISSFARMIERLSRNEELKKKMGDYNLDKVKMFDINIIKKKMENIYNNI